ncbi:MAG: hypothetical protein LBO78_03920 [Rickettsiales bacterium]|jgi:hypothetical protein|nr:hypothetical protein [Rickettsiales bacterium]
MKPIKRHNPSNRDKKPRWNIDILRNGKLDPVAAVAMAEYKNRDIAVELGNNMENGALETLALYADNRQLALYRDFDPELAKTAFAKIVDGFKDMAAGKGAKATMSRNYETALMRAVDIMRTDSQRR